MDNAGQMSSDQGDLKKTITAEPVADNTFLTELAMVCNACNTNVMKK